MLKYTVAKALDMICVVPLVPFSEGRVNLLVLIGRL